MSHEPYVFADARLRTHRLLPYLYHHVVNLVPVKRPGLGTMAVDKYMRVYYDPEMFGEWSMDMAAEVILHEDLHVLLRHHQRAERHIGKNMSQEQQTRANIAADFCCNQVLRNAGFCKSADDWMFPEKFKLPPDLSFEEYYDQLEGKIKTVHINVYFDKDGKLKPGSGGSASDGVQRPWEDAPPGEKNSDGTESAEGLSSYEQTLVEKAVAEAIQRQEQRSRGSVGSYLAKLARDILDPPVDPFRELHAAVKYAVCHTGGHGDFTYRKMPKRSVDSRVRLPASFRPLPRVTVCIDTSGSMGERDLAKAIGVVACGLRSVPSGGIRVVCGDTDAKAAGRVFNARQLFTKENSGAERGHVAGVAQLLGGGGTDMSRVIEYAAKEDPRPDAIVIITDGYTPWPAEPVGPKVVACITQDCGEGPPAWIRTIRMHDGGG